MITFEQCALQNLKTEYDVDILICGGGPAGLGAAIRASRLNGKVMLVEMQDCLGGIATSGMMSSWGGRSSSKVMLEIFDRTKKACEVLGWDETNGCNEKDIHHDAQKIVLDEFFKESGIKVLFNTMVCDTVVENGRVKGVVIQNKSGRCVIACKCVVDSTGDGDVAYYAGVPFVKGREEDGKMQPASVMFKIGGVDYSRAIFPDAFETLVDTPKGEIQALGKKLLPFPAGHVLLYRQPTPGTVCCNMTNAINVDGTNAESVTAALIECRSQIPKIIGFLQEYAPGYEKCWLMSSASLLGVRETRHFVGEKSLTKADILQAKLHDDWVVRRAYFNFDVHNMSGASMDETGVQKKFPQLNDYSIPYGCLVPKGVEGLLLSGRNISGSHLAHSNYRIMSVCIALGEAAGTAAGLFVKNAYSSVKDVKVKDIQEIVGE